MTHQSFPIIGVGASAGGLEAFSKLVERIPPDFAGSIIFVAHLSPSRESDLVQILSRLSKIPVNEVVAGEIPQRGHIYVRDFTGGNGQMLIAYNGKP